MAYPFRDRVLESSGSTGVGDIVLAGTRVGYQTFLGAGFVDADLVYYTAANDIGEWEVGAGTFRSPSVIERTLVLASSNGGALVDFSACPDVFSDVPAHFLNTLAPAGSLLALPAVTQLGAVGDYDVTTETGTDNSTAFASAMALSTTIYVPEGDFYIADDSVNNALPAYTVLGPGRIYGNYFGNKRRYGPTIKAGVASTEIGNDLVGGFVIGGAGYATGGASEGMRLWAQHPSWVQFQPTAPGFPTEVQVYTKSPTGTATGSVSGDVLTAVTGAFSLSPPWANGVELIEAGDEIGWRDTLYHIKTRTSSSEIVIETTSGGAVSITDGAEAVWRHFYQYSYGTCDVSGATVTWRSGMLFNKGGSVAGQKWLFLNGTRYAISSVDSARQITLATSAGTITNAAFIQKDLDGHRSCSILRLQSLAGTKEENVSLNIDHRGRFLIDLQGSLRAPNMVVRGDPSYNGGGAEEHWTLSRDGRFAFGKGIDPAYGGLMEMYAYTATAMASNGTTPCDVMRIRAQHVGQARNAHFWFYNNYQGLAIQSYSSDDTTPVNTMLNPVGGSVGIGTGGTSSLNATLHVAGSVQGTQFKAVNTNTQQLQLDGGANVRWRLISNINGGTDGALILQHTNDGFASNFTNAVRCTEAGSVAVGPSAALATNATDGFLYIPTCAGTPTGTPTPQTGKVPLVYDSSNDKLYVYAGGVWKGGTTPGAFA